MGSRIGASQDGLEAASMADDAALSVVTASGRPLLLLGIRGRLEGEGFRIAAEVTSASELVAAVAFHRPDVCLVDAALPGGALAAAARVDARAERVAIIVLISSDEDEDGSLAVDAVRSGVAGVLYEDMDPSRLVHALRDVAAGGSAVPRMLVPRLLDRPRVPPVVA